MFRNRVRKELIFNLYIGKIWCLSGTEKEGLPKKEFLLSTIKEKQKLLFIYHSNGVKMPINLRKYDKRYVEIIMSSSQKIIGKLCVDDEGVNVKNACVATRGIGFF
jgi:sRNA-binding regulator protein Hfq